MATKIPSKFSSLEYADDFFKKILTKLGAPTTEGNMIFMKAWRQAEGGGAIYNPWNTIQGGYPGVTKYNDTPGVKNYTRLEDGVDATYKTITNGKYPNLIAALKKGLKDKNEAYNLAVSLQQQGKDLWGWVNGFNSKSSNLTGYVVSILSAKKISGKGIPIPIDNNPPPPQNIISGTVRDDKGQPVAGATVQLTQPTIKLSEPTLNPTTGKYEVKDQNGNVIAESIDGEVARRRASDIVNPNTVRTTNPPAPAAPSSTPTVPTVQGYPDTPFKTSTESDDFRRWLLSKYPNYGTQTGAYRIDPPPQPKYINTEALKKAYSEKGTEYNIANAKFTSSENMDPTAVEEPVTVVTDKDGNWQITAPTTVDLGNSTVTFSKEGHEIREINKIQQTEGDIAGGEGKKYEVPRILMPTAPDVTATSTDKVNQEILTEETALIKQQGNSELSPSERLANMANNKKEELKKTLIPFIIKLLAPFGAVALQAVISKIPLDKIKNQVLCPNQAKILELINKRNKLVKQINNVYNTITTLSKVLTGINIAITAIQAGILVLETLPYPATGFPPLGLPPLTTGIIETTGTGKDKLKEALKKANVVISIVTLSLAAFGAVLGIVLRLLNSLDALIQQCAQEQDIPFETINTELNIFVNQSTGVSNSAVIADDNTYKGFALEIKLDEASTSKYPRRFAQALTKQGVPVLKTDSSFASDPQVLLNQLKFIIDSNPQLTAE